MSFLASDDTPLTGRLFGRERNRHLGVLLIHSSQTDMRSWIPAARDLMALGYAAFAIDLRGHSQSEGKADPKGYPDDIASAARMMYLFGVDKALVVGVEAGGTAAVVAAAKSSKIIRAVMTIESTPVFETLDATHDARQLTLPTLVVASSAEKANDLASHIKGAKEDVRSLGADVAADQGVQGVMRDFLKATIGSP